MKPIIQAINENSIIIYFSNKIEHRLPSIIAASIRQIKASTIADSIIDFTPSYTSLLITFNPLIYTSLELVNRLDTLIDINNTTSSKPGKLVIIPAYYSPETGLDLVETANLLKLSIEELIALHSTQEYQVYALGFLPGYAFMGILNAQLELPRLSTPRTKVPCGSVAIAENQTAVYPSETPGGWRLLGRTPIKLFDATSNPPQPYQIGDRVRFNPIKRTEYLALGGKL